MTGRDQWLSETASRGEVRPCRASGTYHLSVGIPDYLDISLQDSELLGEVDLMVRLIVAANESDRALSRRAVDEILEVRPAAAGRP